ncbi:GDSL esterase/lipase At5g55050 [Ricinus communis]|uniref:Zinc finger protein, putative n=1 Tax=Ricinus communis TaxID=3988 RepID=B9SV92_RICCO|nr:GDSL esterase/lipase At5g55050 [Ricinus communis]EEF32465.1 zinc finger protein, putative [Ricinus communis]|eukprot:XP_002529911.1 GDSL esterase/lipase At5g55050 [Ricinus communis]
MALNPFPVTSFFFFILSFLIIKCSEADQMVPAMFVFGDSGVDVGNNNYLPFSFAKADYPYNGIDFPTKKPTGRFSNGKNAADFLAEKLGVPTSPPYLSLLFKKNTNSFLTGVNFASGASGILNGTGKSLGIVIPLTKQVDYYAIVYKDLVQKLGSYAANKLLSKSLFVTVTGSNDLLRYSGSSDLRKKSNPQQYVDSMTLTMKAQIKRLHSYGARKYLFPGLGTVGCAPSQRIKNEARECNEEVNSFSVKYNEGLKLMLQELKSELQDINYSYFDTYNVLQNIIQKPAAYGFTEAKAACCGLGKLNAEVPCIPISTYCSNRSNHVFWDMVHPTEATDRILVNTIFDNQSHYIFPMNMRQLIAV